MLPTRGLKWLKNAVFVHYFVKFPPKGTKISSARGLDASDKGAEMAEKCSFRTLFCQISSKRNPKFPPPGG